MSGGIFSQFPANFPADAAARGFFCGKLTSTLARGGSGVFEVFSPNRVGGLVDFNVTDGVTTPGNTKPIVDIGLIPSYLTPMDIDTIVIGVEICGIVVLIAADCESA